MLKTQAIKYPRTPHLPWSPGPTKGDKMLSSVAAFEGQRVIVTTKMDGENTTLYKDYMHARSLDSRSNVSRHWMQNFHAEHGSDIPEGWRVCGENMYGKHSIPYCYLAHYFLMFSIWNDENVCLSWDETLEWSKMLDFTTVPILYDGVFNKSLIRNLFLPYRDHDPMEGYVIRLASAFHYRDFGIAVAKFVRPGHVRTGKHWMQDQLALNTLRTQVV